MSDPEIFDDDDTCGNCGGEGFVANCWDEISCVDPEYGCELCMVPCDWCNRRTRAGSDSGDAK